VPRLGHQEAIRAPRSAGKTPPKSTAPAEDPKVAIQSAYEVFDHDDAVTRSLYRNRRHQTTRPPSAFRRVFASNQSDGGKTGAIRL
jgi:hypothetical protein